MRRTRFFLALLSLLILMLMISCDQIFTYSPFSFLQRNPANMSDEQKINYAEQALASGDPAAAAEVYPEISELANENPQDGDLQLLASDLALGASGVTEQLVTIDPSNPPADYNSLLADIDVSLLSDVSTYMDNAVASGVEITEAQYVNAAVAIIVSEANSASADPADYDFAALNLDTTTPDANGTPVEQALYYAQQGGVDIASYF